MAWWPFVHECNDNHKEQPSPNGKLLFFLKAALNTTLVYFVVSMTFRDGGQLFWKRESEAQIHIWNTQFVHWVQQLYTNFIYYSFIISRMTLVSFKINVFLMLYQRRYPENRHNLPNFFNQVFSFIYETEISISCTSGWWKDFLSERRSYFRCSKWRANFK